MKNKFAIRVKELRLEKGWTQQELADKLDYKRNSICNWEIHNKEPDFDMLIKIAHIFNVSTDYLLGVEDI